MRTSPSVTNTYLGAFNFPASAPSVFGLGNTGYYAASTATGTNARSYFLFSYKADAEL